MPRERVPAPEDGTEPRIVHRSQHPISRKNIDDEALKVLYRLSSLGFKAYLVGGGVRDLYIGKKPKDFDVCTDAKPSRLKKIFRNCRIIGRRFRIAHIFFPGDQIVEVATFRRGEVHRITKDSGVVLLDNEYGTAEEDARRRDITINGLFYDIATHAIIDYVGGVEDLDNRIVRTINDPDRSFQEDPVRMIRTLRHAVRTGFRIEENTLQAIYRNRQEIAKANTSRLLEEMFRDLKGGAAEPFFRSAIETHLLDEILPSLAKQLREEGPGHPLWQRMRVLDQWSEEGREPTSSTLLSLLLHTVLVPFPETWTGERSGPSDVWRTLMRNFVECTQHIRISRRDAERVAQILTSFRKLFQAYQKGHLPPVFQKKPYLAEALDFMEADLISREQPVDRIIHWRKECIVEPPARPDRYTFGEGGFLGERKDRTGAPGDRSGPGERGGRGRSRGRRRGGGLQGAGSQEGPWPPGEAQEGPPEGFDGGPIDDGSQGAGAPGTSPSPDGSPAGQPGPGHRAKRRRRRNRGRGRGSSPRQGS